MTNRFIEHVTDTEADLPSRVHFHLCVYMLDAMAAGGHSSQPELAQGCSRVSCRGRCRRAARPARGHAIPLSPSPLSNTVKLLACPPLPTRLISDPGYAGHSFNLFAPAVSPPPRCSRTDRLLRRLACGGTIEARSDRFTSKCDFLPNPRRPQ